MTGERTAPQRNAVKRHGLAMLASLGVGAVIAAALSPVVLFWLRDRLRWACDIAPGDVSAGESTAFVCGDGIMYSVPIAGVLATCLAACIVMSLSLVAVDAARRTRQIVALAVLAVSALPVAGLAWWALPKSETHELLWLAWSVPGLAILAVSVALAAVAVFTPAPTAQRLSWVAIALTLIAAIASLGGLAAVAVVVASGTLIARFLTHAPGARLSRENQP